MYRSPGSIGPAARKRHLRRQARTIAICSGRKQQAPKGDKMTPNAASMAGGIDEMARSRPRSEAGLSIVIPVFNEAKNLPILHNHICEVAKLLLDQRKLACEVVYVDDGSSDATLAVARDLNPDPLDVQVISLSRNFGKEAALLAGLDHARLGAILFMDGDGQHSPALVETLVGHLIDGGFYV